MKTTGTMNGGSLNTTVINSCKAIFIIKRYLWPTIAVFLDATYLLKALEGFKEKGVNVYAISIQNEPENSNPTYPTATLSAANEAKIGIQLKALMRTNGFSNVKLIGAFT